MISNMKIHLILTIGFIGSSISCRSDTSLEEVSRDDIIVQAQSLQFGIEKASFLNRGAIHEYEVVLLSGQSLRAELMQEGLDVVVELINPKGGLAFTSDLPIEGFGPEVLCFVTQEAGRHRIRVRSWKRHESGTYNIRVDPMHSASTKDRKCMEATAAFRSVEDLWGRHNRPKLSEIRGYIRALNLWEKSGHRYSSAVALKQLGLAYLKLDYLENAALHLEKAMLQFSVLKDKRQVGSACNHLGLIYRRLGKLDRAKKHLTHALVGARETNDREREASALNNLAMVAHTRGEYNEALLQFNQALEIQASLGNLVEQATIFHNIGTTLSTLGRYEDSITALNASRNIRAGFDSRYFLGSTLTAIGWTYFLAGDLESSKSRLLEAINTHRDVGNRVGEAVALDRLGSVYRELKRFPDALQVYNESLEFLTLTGDLRSAAGVQANIGWLLETWGRSSEAYGVLGRSLASFQAIGDRAGQAHILAGMAQSLRSLGRLDESRLNIEAALDLIEKLRSSAKGFGDRFRAIPLWQDYDEFYIELLVEIYERGAESRVVARAFEHSDYSRARGLYELLRESQVDLYANVSPDLYSEEAFLRERIDATEERLQEQLITQSESPEITNLTSMLNRLLSKFYDLQSRIRVDNPDFMELRSPEPLTLADIQSLLDDKTILLSFVLGNTRSHLFLVQLDGLEYYELPAARQITQLARATYNGLSNFPRIHAHNQLEANVRELSRCLLGPISDKLNQQRIVIVSDGILHYVPFSALPIPEAGSESFGESLVDRHEVVRLPSVAVLRILRERSSGRPTAPKTLAVLADPATVSETTFSGEGGQPFGAIPDLPTLPFARQEAEILKGLTSPAESFIALGPDASMDLVTSGALKDYRILHFATHGIFNEVRPNLSGLMLSGGFLRLHKIYGLDLPADLVVLSACRTALGKHVRGTGLVGLTRGFFYAGASRLIVGLWDLDDEATCTLMGMFYKALLGDGLSPSAALRAAKLEMRRTSRWKAPYFWAGVVIQGEWR